MPLRIVRRNVQAGKMTPHGFVPFRSSLDYDPDRPHEFDSGAATDNQGAGRYMRKRKAKAKLVKRKAKKKTAKRRVRRNPIHQPIPGLAKWNTFSGGTFAAAGKHGYDLSIEPGQLDGRYRTYTIQPISWPNGRHKGYHLGVAGSGEGGLHKDLGMFRSPQAAATAAKAHYARTTSASNPSRRNGLRPAKGKESERVRKALTKYVRGKKNPGKAKRAARAKDNRHFRSYGLTGMKGLRSTAQYLDKADRSNRRGRQTKAPRYRNPNTWTITAIKAANRAAGGHFFDKNTVSFFASKTDTKVYSGSNGVYFVDSAQFVSSEGVRHPRVYKVCQFYPESGRVTHVGGSQHPTVTSARDEAKTRAGATRANPGKAKRAARSAFRSKVRSLGIKTRGIHRAKYPVSGTRARAEAGRTRKRGQMTKAPANRNPGSGTYLATGRAHAHTFLNRDGKPIIPDTGNTVSLFLKLYPGFYSNSGVPHTQTQFKSALAEFRRGLKAGVKATRRNPKTDPFARKTSYRKTKKYFKKEGFTVDHAKFKRQLSAGAKRVKRSNPRGGIKVYAVRVPKSGSCPGYSITVRAKLKRTAIAEARTYCTTKHGTAPRGITAKEQRAA